MPTGRPSLVAGPGGASIDDIQAIRNAGVSALVVEVDSADEIAELREAIASLPSQRSSKSDRHIPLAPTVASSSPVADDVVDDDDDYEDI